MTKLQFLDMIRLHLRQFGTIDAESSLEYYSELIDDYMEDGCTEEEAVAKMGTVEEIIAQITAQQSTEGSQQTHAKGKSTLKWWHKLIIIITSPIWLALLIAVAAAALGVSITALSLYITVWAVLISLYAAVFALAAGALAGLVITVIYLISSHGIQAIFMFGCTLICAGLAVFAFIGVHQLTKWYIRFGSWIIGFGRTVHGRKAK